jgi:hypothetical protein
MPSVRSLAILVAAACLTAGFVPPASAQVNNATVAAAVADLKSGDRDKVVAGRTSLLAVLNAARTNPPALAGFAKDLNTQLMPVALGNDPHAKLNAAIVVLRVTDQAASPDLAPLVAKLVGDSSSAVSAYGLRAASNVLPRMLSAPKAAENNPIVPAIVGSVSAHPESEAVAIEAYNAIVRVLNDRTAGETLTPAGVDAATPRAVDALLPLLSARIAQYGKGTLVEPNAEQPAASFLGKRKTFELSTPPQRTTTIRTLLQLMNVAGAEMVEVSKVNSPTSRLRLNDLRNLVKTTAGSLSVISELSQKPALQELARKVAGYGGATPVTEYRQGIADLSAAFYKDMPETRPPSTEPATAAP